MRRQACPIDHRIQSSPQLFEAGSSIIPTSQVTEPRLRVEKGDLPKVTTSRQRYWGVNPDSLTPGSAPGPASHPPREHRAFRSPRTPPAAARVRSAPSPSAAHLPHLERQVPGESSLDSCLRTRNFRSDATSVRVVPTEVPPPKGPGGSRLLALKNLPNSLGEPYDPQ